MALTTRREEKGLMRISIIGNFNGSHALSKGYTLLELAVVMVLIGIFLGFSVPKLRQNLFSSDLKSSVRILKGQIEQLRTDAVRRHEDLALTIDIDSNSYRVVPSRTKDPEQKEVTPIQLPSGVDITRVDSAERKVTVGSTKIIFSRKGYVSESLIHLTDRSATAYTILIRPFLPKVRIEKLSER